MKVAYHESRVVFNRLLRVCKANLADEAVTTCEHSLNGGPQNIARFLKLLVNIPGKVKDSMKEYSMETKKQWTPSTAGMVAILDDS
jgi:hypothetical protein